MRDDTPARLDACDDQDAFGIELLDAYLTRDKSLGIAVLVDNALAVSTAQDGFAGHRDATPFLGRRGKHSQELTGTQAIRIASNREVNRD